MSTSAVARGPANGGGGRAGGIPEWQQALRRHAESLRTVNQIIVKNAADAPLQQRRQVRPSLVASKVPPPLIVFLFVFAFSSSSLLPAPLTDAADAGRNHSCGIRNPH